jgi:hypothetical protein
LKVSGLNPITKRHRLAEWIFLKRSNNMQPVRNSLYQLKIYWKWQDGKRYFHNIRSPKQAEVDISDKIDFMPNPVRRNKEHYRMMEKDQLSQKVTMIVNLVSEYSIL